MMDDSAQNAEEKLVKTYKSAPLLKQFVTVEVLQKMVKRWIRNPMAEINNIVNMMGNTKKTANSQTVQV